jgi:hypothetical protein
MCLSTEEIEEICASRPRTGAILQAESDSAALVVIGFAHQALKGR